MAKYRLILEKLDGVRPENIYDEVFDSEETNLEITSNLSRFKVGRNVKYYFQIFKENQALVEYLAKSYGVEACEFRPGDSGKDQVYLGTTKSKGRKLKEEYEKLIGNPKQLLELLHDPDFPADRLQSLIAKTGFLDKIFYNTDLFKIYWSARESTSYKFDHIIIETKSPYSSYSTLKLKLTLEQVEILLELLNKIRPDIKGQLDEKTNNLFIA